MPSENAHACPRCGRDMKTVATIPPVGHQTPGLVAFLCSYCGAAESELIEPAADTDSDNDRRGR